MFEFKTEENSGHSDQATVDGISAIEIDKSGKRFKLTRTKKSHHCDNFDFVHIFRLVTGTQNGKLKLWNYNNGHCIKTFDKGGCDYHVATLSVFTVWYIYSL